MKHLIQRVAPVLALCLAALGPDATAAQAEASAPLSYRSAFADYKPWQDTRLGDWRALNDAVKGDSMSAMDMSGMKGTGDTNSMANMPATNGMSGHGMPMSSASSLAHGSQSHPPSRAASMPATHDMSAHPGHDTQGGHQ